MKAIVREKRKKGGKLVYPTVVIGRPRVIVTTLNPKPLLLVNQIQVSQELGPAISLTVILTPLSFTCILLLLDNANPNTANGSGAGPTMNTTTKVDIAVGAATTAGVVGGVAAGVVPAVQVASVTAMGFTTSGIVGGSAAAGMMAAEATALGGGVASMAAGGRVCWIKHVTCHYCTHLPCSNLPPPCVW
jgi:hypothetical protein